MKKLLILTLFFFSGVTAFAQDAGYWRSDTFCINTSIRYINRITINGQPPQWWAWSMPGASPDTFYSTTTDTSPYFSFSAGGFYTVTLTMKLADGRDTSIYADVLVNNPNPPNNQLGNDTTYCGAFSRVLDAGNAGSNYLWSTGATTQRITVDQPGTYSVDISNKCYSGTFEINIYQEQNPFVDLGPDAFVCHDAPLTLRTGNADPDIDIRWSTGDSSYTLETNSPDTFWVRVESQNGCFSRDTIIVRDSCPPDLFFPNAFTPNDDGINDTIAPYTNGIASLEYQIYDRWGELIFETDKLNEGWDGKHRGKPCPDGMFFWIARALDNSGNLHIRKGELVLIR